MSTPIIEINMNQKCAECGKGGAAPNRLCLKCTCDAMIGNVMKSAAGREVAGRFKRK